MLVVKSLLKANGLNDVSTGGLGSFALANMALAHLQEDAKVRLGVHSSQVSMTNRAGTLSCSCAASNNVLNVGFAGHYASALQFACSIDGMAVMAFHACLQLGSDTDDFGEGLLGFLERFGGGDGGESERAFDYTNDAVSVGRGGVVRKAQVPAMPSAILQSTFLA